jgi:hypothetical protein
MSAGELEPLAQKATGTPPRGSPRMTRSVPGDTPSARRGDVQPRRGSGRTSASHLRRTGVHLVFRQAPAAFGWQWQTSRGSGAARPAPPRPAASRRRRGTSSARRIQGCSDRPDPGNSGDGSNHPSLLCHVGRSADRARPGPLPVPRLAPLRGTIDRTGEARFGQSHGPTRVGRTDIPHHGRSVKVGQAQRSPSKVA